MVFRLNEIVSSDFAGLYDNYRIRGVRVTFYPHSSNYWNSSGNNETTGGIPWLIVAPDNDSNETLSYEEFLQRGGVRQWSFTKPVSVYIPWPTLAIGVHTSGGAQRTVMIKAGEWLDMANHDVAHYGLHYGMNLPRLDILPSIIPEFQWSRQTTFYLELRGVR